MNFHIVVLQIGKRNVSSAIKTIIVHIIQGVSHSSPVSHVMTVQFNHVFHPQVTWMVLRIPMIVLTDLIILPEMHC